MDNYIDINLENAITVTLIVLTFAFLFGGTMAVIRRLKSGIATNPAG